MRDSARSRQHLQIVWCAGRLGRRVPDRPALHEDDRLLAIAANRRGSQAEHELRLGPFQDGIEGNGARRGGIRRR